MEMQIIKSTDITKIESKHIVDNTQQNVIIAGSRVLTSQEYKPLISKVLKMSGIHPTTIISGGAPAGIDRLGKEWAMENNIPVNEMKAFWERFGQVAGHMRNNEMATIGDVLLLIWDGKSKGSKHMRSAALQRGLMVLEVVVDYEDIEYIENPDERTAKAIKNRMEKCGGYCPCSPARDVEHLCPCLKFRETAACCCGLYLRK